MAWTKVSLTYDTDSTTIGTAVSTYTHTDSDIFTFSLRITRNTAGLNAYYAAANAAKDAWIATKTQRATDEATILTKLNS